MMGEDARMAPKRGRRERIRRVLPIMGIAVTAFSTLAISGNILFLAPSSPTDPQRRLKSTIPTKHTQQQSQNNHKRNHNRRLFAFFGDAFVGAGSTSSSASSFADFFVPKATSPPTEDPSEAPSEAPTQRPTNRPTPRPTPAPTLTASPTCKINLPNSFQRLVVIHLRLAPDEKFWLPMDELGTVVKKSYNHIVDLQYSTCDEAYRMAIDARHVDTTESGIDEIDHKTDESSSFVFRRQVQETEPEALLRGNHERRQGRRRTQFETKNVRWKYYSVLFEVTVACRGIFCTGEYASLFGSSSKIVSKTGFTQAYAENLDRVLGWKGEDDAREALSVSAVRELEEQACPVERNVFSQEILLELVHDSSASPLAGPEDPRWAPIEDAYVFAYNQVIRNEFCDPFFRRLTSAKVMEIGVPPPNTNTVPVKMLVVGQCRGDCQSTNVYDVPSMEPDSANPSSSTSGSRYLAEPYDGKREDKWLVSPLLSSNGRSLQEDGLETCYCDAQPFDHRAPFEAEVVSRFQRLVEALASPGFSSTNTCEFRSMFSIGLVTAFSKAELRHLQEANGVDNTKSVLEVALKDTFNELLTSNEICYTDFREVSTVQLVPSNLNPNKDGRRSLFSQWEKPVIRLVNETASNATKNLTNCFDGVTNSTGLGNVTDSNVTNTAISKRTNATGIACIEEIPEESEAPTFSPFDPFALLDDGDAAPVFFYVAGDCSGCDNSFLNVLSNDVVRRLKTKLAAASKDSRELQEPTEEPEDLSDCFCPLNATQSSEKLDSTVVSNAYEENLQQNYGLNYNVQIIDEVDCILCDNEDRNYKTTVNLTLSGDIAESGFEALAKRFNETYNNLNALYCDPYSREITDIRVNLFPESRSSQGCGKRTLVKFDIEGHCLGCSNDQYLFDIDSSVPLGLSHIDQKRKLQPLFDSRKLSIDGNDEIIRPKARRKLEKSDVCFCVGDTVADRAPTFDEFIAVFEDQALAISGVCEIIEVVAGEDNGSLDDEDLKLIAYYRAYFHRPPTEAPVVPPAYYLTQEPTNTPSMEPTMIPTIEPTDEPTEEPTEEPTDDPTDDPTQAPTPTPTTAPSNGYFYPFYATRFPFQETTPPFITTAPPFTVITAPPFPPFAFMPPSKLPTPPPVRAPTDIPTDIPTPNPTNSPTGSPTTGPTKAPTGSPTGSPTDSPTDSSSISGGILALASTSSPTPEPAPKTMPALAITPGPTPTASPTNSPTTGPTNSPTTGPTKSPTDSPTATLTSSPTASPTTSPTKAPTDSPTATLTNSPTGSPVGSSTGSPTKTPTKSPTASPTDAPTGSPTTSPTGSPAASPTDEPTGSPVVIPTDPPTTSPTDEPTGSPAASPTGPPTTSPTNEPTGSPVASPTDLPTVKPTDAPTDSPIVSPTEPPTASPTDEPTGSPTASPTDPPTVKPTNAPTDLPTVSPTDQPTVKPTDAPTDPPTISPTDPPTVKPTDAPTVSPTSKPTKKPTKKPTNGAGGYIIIQEPVL